MRVTCFNPYCAHSAPLGTRKLIKRFGPDFIPTERSLLARARWRCSKCGNTHVGFTVIPMGAYFRRQKTIHWPEG